MKITPKRPLQMLKLIFLLLHYLLDLVEAVENNAINIYIFTLEH